MQISESRQKRWRDTVLMASDCHYVKPGTPDVLHLHKERLCPTYFQWVL